MLTIFYIKVLVKTTYENVTMTYAVCTLLIKLIRLLVGGSTFLSIKLVNNTTSFLTVQPLAVLPHIISCRSLLACKLPRPNNMPSGDWFTLEYESADNCHLPSVIQGNLAFG